MSVVVPVRNRRTLLGELLDALENQVFRDFEVIVVDDGSSDGSGDVARAPRNMTVRVLRTGGGAVGIARNAGVADAQGEIIAFTDSDCVPDPEWLAEGVDAMQRAGVDVAQGATVPTGHVGPFERSMNVEYEDGLYATCNMFFRRASFERAGGFDLSTHEFLGFGPGSLGLALGFGVDTLLAWKVKRQGGSVFVPSSIVRHQVMPLQGHELVSRAWLTAAFPALMREIPELGSMLGASRFFLGPRRIPFYGFLAALVLRKGWLASLLALWWLVARGIDVSRSGGSRRKRVAAMPVEMGIDVVTAVSLVVGSARARKLVL